MKAGDVQIAEHLGNVGVTEGTNHFGVNYYRVVNNQIGYQSSDVVVVVKTGYCR